MPSIQEENIERKVVVRNPNGLHMRPAMQFVECANRFSSQIVVCKDDLSVDGKSIMQITMLAATHGTELRIKAMGKDAEEAITTLTAMIESETVDD